MHLFQTGNFILHSGEQSHFKIECDSLIYDDWETLARMISYKYAFSAVEGVPRGGIPLANALQKYCDHEYLYPTLIVDDVLTSGNSMEQQRNGRNGVYGVVVFARGRCPSWVDAIWHFGL
jgi:orotate phosphoribosyltransferase